MWFPIIFCYTLGIFNINAHQHHHFMHPYQTYQYQHPSSNTHLSRFDGKNHLIQKVIKSIRNFSTAVKNVLSGRAIDRQDLDRNTISILSGIAILVGWFVSTAIDAFLNTPSNPSIVPEASNWVAAPVPSGIIIALPPLAPFAIEAQIIVANGVTRSSFSSQSTDKTLIEGVLNAQFCQIQNLDVVNQCSIQISEIKDAAPLSGLVVNFLVVIETFANSVADIVTELNTINDALGTDAGTGLNFVGVIIEDCSGNACDSCPGEQPFINGACSEIFACIDDTSCNGQGTCGATTVGECDCNDLFEGVDCIFNVAVDCPPRKFLNMGISCQNCPNAGEVPSPDRLSCMACQASQITVAGVCQTCSNGQVPNADQTSCVGVEEYSEDPEHIRKVLGQTMWYGNTKKMKEKEKLVGGDSANYKPQPQPPET